MSAATLKQLKLSEAVVHEASTARNLLPSEPGWNRLAARADDLANFIGNRLRAGYSALPEVEVAARKAGHGVRPVAYWGVLERVLYRAITNAVLRGRSPVDRSPEAYLRFVGAPLSYADQLQKDLGDNEQQGPFHIMASPVKYVVKSDITAFYQFVDHAVLAEELLLLGADYELIEALLELLAEVQGRSYGLPQLLDASDELSDIYIDRVERSLLRQGVAAWRFNDDFRIACLNYSDALAAIESLDREARAAGLVINENKTVTVGFIKYLFDVTGKEPSEVGETIALDEVEDVIGDYTDDFGEEHVDAALRVLRSAQPDAQGDGGINLRGLRGEDVRLLRRALNGLAKAGDARGVEAVIRLVVFAPSLTPTVMRYLATVAANDGAAAGDIVDELIAEAPLNDWQKLWVIDAMRSLELLAHGADDHVASRIEWVRGTLRSTRSHPVRAVATRALAGVGHMTLEEALSAADTAPGALLTIYITAAREAANATTKTGSPDKQLKALAGVSELHSILASDS